MSTRVPFCLLHICGAIYMIHMPFYKCKIKKMETCMPWVCGVLPRAGCAFANNVTVRKIKTCHPNRRRPPPFPFCCGDKRTVQVCAVFYKSEPTYCFHKKRSSRVLRKMIRYTTNTSLYFILSKYPLCSKL